MILTFPVKNGLFCGYLPKEIELEVSKKIGLPQINPYSKIFHYNQPLGTTIYGNLQVATTPPFDQATHPGPSASISLVLGPAARCEEPARVSMMKT